MKKKLLHGKIKFYFDTKRIHVTRKENRLLLSYPSNDLI